MPECMWGVPEQDNNSNADHYSNNNNDNNNNNNNDNYVCQLVMSKMGVTSLDAQDSLPVMSRCMHE